MGKRPAGYYVEAAAQYLARARLDSEAAMPVELQRYPGEPSAIMRALMPKPAGRVEKGLIRDRPFRVPGLAQKYQKEKMTLFVPPDYNHRRPRRLIIMLHGGGKSPAAATDDSWCTIGSKVWDTYEISDLFQDAGALVCLPCAPCSAVSSARWNLPQVDDYLLDVIAELEQFYRIDRQQVFLLGHSMGGFGGYHLLQRMSDVFAGFCIGAGTWNYACWAAAAGTEAWLLQGVNDAVCFKRKHWTDIEYARQACLGLQRAGVNCVYREHPLGHALWNSRPALREWLAHIRDVRRDPFHPRVVAVSPRGETVITTGEMDQRGEPIHAPTPAPHCRWITLGRIGPESMMFEYAPPAAIGGKYQAVGDWDDFHLPVRRKNIRGGIVEAQLCAGVIEAAAKNVDQFTAWLHPAMLDLRRVTLRVNGRVRFQGAVKPSLAVALESYLRRRDWGLIYPARVTIMQDEFWQNKDQIGLKKHAP